jgi:YD repeat-containing protein
VGRVIRTSACGSFGSDARYSAHNVSPAGDVWTITRSNCLVSEIAGPGGRTTTISGGTVTQPGGRVTTFGQDKAKNLTSVTYPGGDSISLTYGEKHLLSSITVGGERPVLRMIEPTGFAFMPPD